MPNFSKLWDFQYLFGPNSLELSLSDRIFFWGGLVFAVIGILTKIFSIQSGKGSPKKYLFQRLFRVFATMGLLNLFWVGARYENIPWISTRFVVLLLYLGAAIWLIFIGKYFIQNYKSQQKLWEDEQIKYKYLVK